MPSKKAKHLKYDLFIEQPAECRVPLEFKEVDAPEYVKRVLFFDPAPVYERVRFDINPYRRYSYVKFDDLFPDNGDVCACGCGKEVSKKGSKWHSLECQQFAVGVYGIVVGRPENIRWYLRFYYGKANCKLCGKPAVDLDHRIPLARGGGSCWLSNFDPLCEECHKEKTRQDFNWIKLKK